MAPVIPAVVVSSATTAGETAGVASSTREAGTVSAAMREGMGTVETKVIVGEEGLTEQMTTIRYGSHEAVAARNEGGINEVSQVERNRLDGAEREKRVEAELLRDYPPEHGYKIERQVCLRNQDRLCAHDPAVPEGTAGTRRLDFVVIKEGQVMKSVEVTSETAPKELQSAKEDRIREAGGNYILDRSTDKLVPFAPGVRTEIVRRP